MKKAFIFLAFLGVIFSHSLANATSFSLIQSNFRISGDIFVKGLPPTSIDYFYGSYSEESSAPLINSISFRRSYVGSEATFGGVEAFHLADNSFYAESDRGDTNAGAYAEADLLFRPNFSGEGYPITFVCSAWDFGGPSEVSIWDQTTQATIFSELLHPAWDPEPVVSYSISYSEWDPNHIYRLYMSAISGPGSAWDGGSAGVTNNMSFVPEPTTMLLLGLGLMGLVGVRRKFNN